MYYYRRIGLKSACHYKEISIQDLQIKYLNIVKLLRKYSYKIIMDLIYYTKMIIYYMRIKLLLPKCNRNEKNNFQLYFNSVFNSFCRM